ncbi:hypothetical protein HY524_00305 [Candidatus Berkelbacteria bacterium]|nr:hypothetical protein [Candidatus Berkelbacteria bacterium]
MEDESVHEKLDDVRQHIQRDRSIAVWLWRGLLFGVGSTLGVALIFYLFLLVAQQLSNVPVLGKALQQLEPLLKQTAETRVPNVEQLLPPVPKGSDESITDHSLSSTVAGDQTNQSSVSTTNGQTVTDPAGFYTFNVSANWAVNQEELETPTPEVLSTMVIQSPEWQTSTQKPSNTKGMYISLSVLRDTHTTLGTTDSEVNGEPAASDHTDSNGLQTDTVRWNHRNHGYTFTATYNPSTYDGPGKLIEEMLLSFKFTD